MESLFSNAPKLYMFVVFIVLLSSVMWLYIGVLHSEYRIELRIVMIIIGILAILVMANRDVYLPFLGPCAIPSSALPLTESRGNVTMTLSNLPPNTKVIYWAANPSKKNGKNPWSAYKNYANGGVTMSDDRGNATLSLMCPQRYTINRLGFDKLLPKHLHYRFESKEYPGMLSRVYTEDIDCDE